MEMSDNLDDPGQSRQHLSNADALLVSLGFDLASNNKLIAEAEQRRRQQEDERQLEIVKEATRVRLDTRATVVEATIKRTTMDMDEQDRRGLKHQRHPQLIHK
jgi:hypothetical protein